MILRPVVEVFGVVLFVFVILIVWCFIKKPDKDIMTCILTKFGIKKKTDSDSDEVGDGVENDITDSPDENLKCMFPTSDVLSGMVFTNDGDIVTSQPDITCADCTKYVYKDREGKCYKFVHDPEYNADNYCLSQEGGTCKDACTSQFMPTDCPF